jgi:signal transduction histidine kinase
MLLFASAAAVVVLTAAVGMVVLVGRAVWKPLDAALEEEAETLDSIRGLSTADEFANAVVRIAQEHDLGREKFVRVVGADGTIQAAAGTGTAAGAAVAGAAATLPSQPTPHAESVWHHGHAFRLMRYPNRGGGWTALGVNADARVRTLRRSYAAIAGTTVALLAAVALLAWTITTRAVAELGLLAAELETLEAGALDRRVAPRRTTEVDRLSKVLNRLLERLERAVGQLRRFTADAAHELRSPIAALRARIEVTLERAATAEAYRDGLLDALEQTERMARLAEDLLTLNSVEAGTGIPGPDERVRVDELAHEVEQFLEPVAQEQGRQFRCRTEGAVTVRGASPLLKRLLVNLIDNAFRHTPASAAVVLAVWRENGTACIEVSDDGPGITADELPLVFQRFHRGPSGRGGSGLGLALCQEIVNRHGGRIAIDSRPGEGTTVTVTLPE